MVRHAYIGRLNAWMNKWMDERTDGYLNIIHHCLNIFIINFMDVWMGRWMDGMLDS